MITFERKEINADTFEFSALENEAVIGRCTLSISSSYADVTSLTFTDGKAFVIEGLIKTAFYYAGLKGCYIGRCSCSGIEAQLERMNLIKSPKGYENDIPTILTGSCSGCKNNN